MVRPKVMGPMEVRVHRTSHFDFFHSWCSIESSTIYSISIPSTWKELALKLISSCVYSFGASYAKQICKFKHPQGSSVIRNINNISVVINLIDYQISTNIALQFIASSTAKWSFQKDHHHVAFLEYLQTVVLINCLLINSNWFLLFLLWPYNMWNDIIKEITIRDCNSS